MGCNQSGISSLNWLTQVTILMFTSGHMFNAIRHTPYTQPDGRGGFSYIAGGFQSQFGIETHIVASLCMSSVILLTKMEYYRLLQLHLLSKHLPYAILPLNPS